jgi:hypothetical protein
MPMLVIRCALSLTVLASGGVAFALAENIARAARDPAILVAL